MIDEVFIRVTAGYGGHGRVAFDKSIGGVGPKGGDGGNGGSIYMEGVSDLSALRNFRFKKEFKADDGKDGGINLRKGSDGEDRTLKVPVGTVAHNLDTKKDLEVVAVGEKILLAEGGKGGRGNFRFRGPKNTSPKQAEQGRPGESFNFQLELQLIADIGLIGLPSAGKSSLLNALTNAGVKVAAYPFTTLEPNLGVLYPEQYFHASDEEQEKMQPIILADIPGLIEGASQGKGLGTKFLRHIQRTGFLVHCISAESTDLKKDYEVIRKELAQHNPLLAQKNECIVLTKIDLLSSEQITEKKKELQKLNSCVETVSILDNEQLAEIKKFIERKISVHD